MVWWPGPRPEHDDPERAASGGRIEAEDAAEKALFGRGGKSPVEVARLPSVRGGRAVVKGRATFHLAQTYVSKPGTGVAERPPDSGPRVQVFPRSRAEAGAVRRAAREARAAGHPGPRYERATGTYTVPAAQAASYGALRTDAAFRAFCQTRRSKGARPAGTAARFQAYIERLTAADEARDGVVERDADGEIALGSPAMGADADERRAFWHAVEDTEGINGRVQTRLIAELPHDVPPAARRRIVKAVVAVFEERDLPVWAVVHRPHVEAGSDARNVHLHVVYHDRPVTRLAPYSWRFAARKVHEVRQAAWLPMVRDRYAAIVAGEQARAASAVRWVPHSYAELGVDRRPQKHLGPGLAGREKRGEATDLGVVNAMRESFAEDRQRMADQRDQLLAIEGDLARQDADEAAGIAFLRVSLTHAREALAARRARATRRARKRLAWGESVRRGELAGTAAEGARARQQGRAALRDLVGILTRDPAALDLAERLSGRGDALVADMRETMPAALRRGFDRTAGVLRRRGNGAAARRALARLDRDVTQWEETVARRDAGASPPGAEASPTARRIAAWREAWAEERRAVRAARAESSADPARAAVVMAWKRSLARRMADADGTGDDLAAEKRLERLLGASRAAAGEESARALLGASADALVPEGRTLDAAVRRNLGAGQMLAAWTAAVGHQAGDAGVSWTRLRHDVLRVVRRTPRMTPAWLTGAAAVVERHAGFAARPHTQAFLELAEGQREAAEARRRQRAGAVARGDAARGAGPPRRPGAGAVAHGRGPRRAHGAAAERGAARSGAVARPVPPRRGAAGRRPGRCRVQPHRRAPARRNGLPRPRPRGRAAAVRRARARHGDLVLGRRQRHPNTPCATGLVFRTLNTVYRADAACARPTAQWASLASRCARRTAVAEFNAAPPACDTVRGTRGATAPSSRRRSGSAHRSRCAPRRNTGTRRTRRFDRG